MTEVSSSLSDLSLVPVTGFWTTARLYGTRETPQSVVCLGSLVGALSHQLKRQTLDVKESSNGVTKFWWKNRSELENPISEQFLTMLALPSCFSAPPNYSTAASVLGTAQY